MDRLTSRTASELDVLYGLYQLALDYTDKIKPDDENEVSKWLETRQRILGKTDKASKTAAALLKEFAKKTNITASERALIEEKKNMIKDLLPILTKKEYELLNKMHYKMGSIRTELAGMARKQTAAKAYINAPKSKLMVA